MGVHDGRHREEARLRADVAIQIVHPGHPSRKDRNVRPGISFPVHLLDCFGAVRLAMTAGEEER